MNKTLIKLIGKSINTISYFSPAYAAKIAINIFSKPHKGKLVNSSEINFLNTAEQGSFSHENITIKTYKWLGKVNKHTILLVHGWESNTYRWKNLITLLQTKAYNIIALDAPAHGASGGKTFNAILYSECIARITKQVNASIIIGHSVGGTSTMFAANKYALPIKKLILLGAPSNFNEIIATYIKTLGYNNRVCKAMDRYFLKKFGHLPNYYTVKNFSKNLKADGLIIHDKNDRIIPLKDALTIHKHYKNSTLIKTEGFGHGLKSDVVYGYITNFLVG